MRNQSNQPALRVLAALALALGACNPDAGGQIPCVEDVSCPNDYPVCGPAGRCIAGTSTAGASVAILGADGHVAADFLSGTVRVLVSARAATGVKTVALASGSTTFPASATAATPPIFAFDVNTTALADGDAPLTATLTAGDGTTGTATGTLHVDNAKPVISSFTVGPGAATAGTVTVGKSIAISASFTGGGTGTITSSTGGSVTIASGASVLVGPDTSSTFRLQVTSRSGVSVSSNSPGQPPDVSVAVVPPAASSFTGAFAVTPNVIDQDQAGTLTFTAPAFTQPGMTAVVNDANGSVGSITSGGNLPVPIPANPTSKTQLTYTLVLSNAATTPDTVSIPIVVRVRPIISSFAFQSTGTSAANFAPGANVTFAHVFNAQGGTATINGVAASGATTTINNIQTDTLFTLTVTNPDGVSVTRTATASVSRINSFTVGPSLGASGSAVTISNGNSTTSLFASFAGSGASGNAPAALSCSPSCNGTLGAGTVASGGSVALTANVNGTLTYTLTVTPSSGGPIGSSVIVKVVPLATATSLAATDPVIAAGGHTTLTPVFDDGPASAAPGSAFVSGSDGSTYGGLLTGVPVTVAPSVTTTYTLHVSNGAGTAAATAPTATVTVSAAPGAWTSLNTTVVEVRKGATVTAVNGKVLIAGGADLTDLPANTARLCDATGACTSLPMNSRRAFHTAVLIPSGTNAGKVLLAGGYTAAALATPTTSAELFDPSTETFSPTTAITTGTVTAARARHVAVALADGKTVLIAGGTDGAADLASAIKYDTDAATPATSNISGTMAQQRKSFTGTLVGTSVLVVGGKTGDTSAELFDPAAAAGSGAFGATGALGEDKRSHTAVLIEGASSNVGKVLISGGLTGAGAGTPSSTQFLYTPPPTGTFASIVPLGTPRSNQAAISVPNSSDMILICGGTSNGSNTLATCERYDPASGSGTMVATTSMLEPRKDFGLAPLTISSLVEMLAAGTPGTPTIPVFAETFLPK